MATEASWDRMWAIFHEALEQPAATRKAFLQDACDGDAALRDEVLAHLSAHERADGFLDGPAVFGGEIESLDVMIGRRIGHFTIRRVIASGGMGVVYEAEQVEPRRTVALKLMRRGLVGRSSLKRFRYEAEILGRLQHPGIAQVHEAGTFDDGEGGVPYFAMEHVPDARTLTGYVESADLDVPERLALFIEICRAVHHGHQRGIIHRDLKPANILVTADGRPKIIDFGVARATDSDLAVTTMRTHVGQLIGTMPYMSPEQCAADVSAIDLRSDVYSLGVVVYEMLTGRTPLDFSTTPLPEAVRRVREEDPVRPSAVVPALRGDLETIVLKALEKSPGDRYQSAQALGEDVARYMHDEPIEARPPSTWYQARKFAVRHKALVAAVVAAILALSAGLVMTTWQAVRAGRAEVRASQRFDDVRRIANALIFDVHDAIEHLPGSTDARERIVALGLEYYERLRATASEDPELLYEIALAYEKIGDVQGYMHNSNLGDRAGALASFNRAIDILERLYEQRRDAEYLFVLGRLTRRIPTVTPNSPSENPYFQVAQYQDRAIGMFEQVPNYRQRPEVLSEYALSLCYLGAANVRISKADQGVEQMFDAARMINSLVTDETDNDDLLYRAAHINGVLGSNLLHFVGTPGNSIPVLRASLAYLDRACELNPENTTARLSRVATQGDLAYGLAAHDKAQEALPIGLAAVNEVESMTAVDPRNQRAFRGLEVALERLGTVYLALGEDQSRDASQRLVDLQSARSMIQRALDCFEARQRRGWSNVAEQGYKRSYLNQIAQCNRLIGSLQPMQDS